MPKEHWCVFPRKAIPGEKNQYQESCLYSLEEFKPRYDKDIQKGYLNGRFGAIPFMKNTIDLNFYSSLLCCIYLHPSPHHMALWRGISSVYSFLGVVNILTSITILLLALWTIKVDPVIFTVSPALGILSN